MSDPISERRKNLAAWTLLKAHRICWNLAFWPTMVVVIGTLMLRPSAQNPEVNLRESLAAVRALQPAPVPDEENAALVYEKAWASRVAYTGAPIRVISTRTKTNTPFTLGPEDPPDRFTVEDLSHPALQSHFSANKNYLDLLRTASRMPKVNWGLNYELGVIMTLPHLAKIRNSARQLALQALVFAKNGDHDAAAENVRACISMAAHGSSDSTLICRSIGIAVRAIAYAAVERILLTTPPSTEKDFQAYRDAIKTNFSPWESAYQTINTEKWLGILTIDQFANNQLNTAGLRIGTDMKFFPSYGSDRKAMVGLKDEILHDVKNRKEQVFDSEGYWERALLRAEGPVMFSSMLASSHGRSIASSIHAAEQYIALDVAIAAMLFQFKYKRDIKDVKELVPEFLESTPTSIFHPDTPLRIRLDESGYYTKWIQHPRFIRVYSAGKNGKDEEGYYEDFYPPPPESKDLKKKYFNADDAVAAFPAANARKETQP